MSFIVMKNNNKSSLDTLLLEIVIRKFILNPFNRAPLEDLWVSRVVILVYVLVLFPPRSQQGSKFFFLEEIHIVLDRKEFILIYYFGQRTYLVLGWKCNSYRWLWFE